MKTSTEKKYNFVYRTTNLVNGKIYIGVHKTNKLDDGYLGSGVYISRAIRKYGKENFKREILKQFDTYQEALNYEEELVTKEFIEESTNYNIKTGGNQNIQLSKDCIERIRIGNRKYWLSEDSLEQREQHAEFIKSLWATDEYRARMIEIFNSESRIEKLSTNIKKWIRENPEAHYERMLKINKNPEKIRKMAEKQTGRPQTLERRANISKSLIGKRKGEENASFKGWWHTPFGKFDSLKAAADASKNGPICIRDRCLIKTNNKVLKFSTITDKNITEDMIGKTWNELGWFFEAAK